jgi:phosphoribosylaminoimidazole (AIR) synthetase
MVVIVAADDALRTIQMFEQQGQKARLIGRLERGNRQVVF